MEKFVPYEKMSKKKRRQLDAARRGDWGLCRPVTRTEDSPKCYKRHDKHRKTFDTTE